MEGPITLKIPELKCVFIACFFFNFPLGFLVHQKWLNFNHRTYSLACIRIMEQFSQTRIKSSCSILSYPYRHKRCYAYYINLNPCTMFIPTLLLHIQVTRLLPYVIHGHRRRRSGAVQLDCGDKSGEAADSDTHDILLGA